MPSLSDMLDNDTGDVAAASQTASTRVVASVVAALRL